MKKLLLILIIIIFFFSIFYFINKEKSFCKNKQTIGYLLNNKNHCLLVADAPNEWSQGLMNFRKPVDFDGMVFIFPDKQSRTFWNKNTYLDLNVYWLEDDEIVGKSLLLSIEKTKKIMTINSPEKVNKVVEIIK